MKAKQGCWTCKQRKIGCDREIPSCNNCTRTRRQCSGYGIRLLWPDRHDGRRKDSGFVVYDPRSSPSESPETYGMHFLNVTFNDIVSSMDSNSYHALVMRNVGRPTRALNLHSTMTGNDALFINYYEAVIAPMISTTQIRNGFRTELMQLALSGADTSTQALWNSMMAVAAFHHKDAAAALPYKSAAVRYLSASLAPKMAENSFGLGETQFAASLMLCIYSVFDETDGNWTTHLDGAKYMLDGLYPDHRHHINSGFLFTWFLYHEVLACFTQPLRQANDWLDVLLLIQTSDYDATLILGALGCSLEIMAIVHRLNKLRAAIIQKETDQSSPYMIQQRLELEHLLHNMVQRLDPNDQVGETQARKTRILATAELYRLATLLYLLHVCSLPGDGELRSAYLQQAFDVLQHLEPATSPWPVFMVACECDTDSHRIQILQIMDKMNNYRNIGNIRVMRNLIETCWKHSDLLADSPSTQSTKWWDFVNYETAVPWFI